MSPSSTSVIRNRCEHGPRDIIQMLESEMSQIADSTGAAPGTSSTITLAQAIQYMCIHSHLRTTTCVRSYMNARSTRAFEKKT